MLPPDSGAGALIDELASLGFDAASDFVCNHEPARIRAAIARVQSRPPLTVRNRPGMIRYLVTKPGPIAPPHAEDNAEARAREAAEHHHHTRYTRGKYGAIVYR